MNQTRESATRLRRWLPAALVQVGRENEALDYLSKALEFASEDEPTLLELSALLVEQKRYKEARDLLDRANRRFPDRGLTAHDLARLVGCLSGHLLAPR